MWASLDDNGQHLYFDSETAYLDFVETQRMVDDLAAVDCVLCAESHTFYVEFCDVRIPAASRQIV